MIHRENWVRMMYCMKHLMTLHPEYKSMIKPFYDQLYEKFPYNEEDPFNFDDDKPKPKTSIESHLDDLADGKVKYSQRHLDDLAELNKKEKEQFESGNLDQMVWDLGLKLPSWNLSDNKKKGKDNDKT